ncbi:unnamed protein product [Somion occarium]|uniref:Cytochrome P450 n=1 Tax=Somion occarium TaxID=3059160 RepID=A0ABP1DFH8_9APHY
MSTNISTGSGLPPGPPTLPLLGNLHVFPKTRAYLKFTEWAKVYGELYSLKAGPANVVILSSPRMVRECIDVKGAATASRPLLHVSELVSNNLEFSLIQYGPTWRSMRRAAHDILSQQACMRHLPIQHAEASQLTFDFLESPELFYTHIYRYTASVIVSVVYGIHCPRYHDSLVDELRQITREFQQLITPGGTPPIDIVPILKHLPERVAPWKARCRHLRARQLKLLLSLLDTCENRRKTDKRNGCFMEYILDNQDRYNLDREQTAAFGGSVIEAGIDTTAMFLQFFVACMIAYPEVQARARKDIDDVIGLNRTPQQDDIENLPYLRALINEIHRFCPIAPMGIPHASTADERIGDYMIPKGTTIVINIWGLYRNEEYFEDPDVFNPERYLQSPYGMKPGVNLTGLRSDYMFGGGRRICPGMHLAFNSITLNTMNLLWAFEFNTAKDPNTGRPIPVDPHHVTDNLLLSPEPFQCNIVPRSDKKAEMIRNQFANAKATFDLFCA